MKFYEWMWEQVQGDWESLSEEEQLEFVTRLTEEYNQQKGTKFVPIKHKEA